MNTRTLMLLAPLLACTAAPAQRLSPTPPKRTPSYTYNPLRQASFDRDVGDSKLGGTARFDASSRSGQGNDFDARLELDDSGAEDLVRVLIKHLSSSSSRQHTVAVYFDGDLAPVTPLVYRSGSRVSSSYTPSSSEYAHVITRVLPNSWLTGVGWLNQPTAHLDRTHSVAGMNVAVQTYFQASARCVSDGTLKDETKIASSGPATAQSWVDIELEAHHQSTSAFNKSGGFALVTTQFDLEQDFEADAFAGGGSASGTIVAHRTGSSSQLNPSKAPILSYRSLLLPFGYISQAPNPTLVTGQEMRSGRYQVKQSINTGSTTTVANDSESFPLEHLVLQ